jgi:hypothetical protein
MLILALALLQPVDAPARLHPVITEVLYAVPRDGDADQDGTRSPTGDEFIELVNPHDKPINLMGYTLTDGKSPVSPNRPAPRPASKPKTPKPDTPPDEDDSRIRFTFPDLTLQPGHVVVVFNGYESRPPGPVGDAKAPAAQNPKFHNAYILSMRVASQYTALANAGDLILLSDPDAKGVECVTWGDSDKKPDAAAPISKAPESKGSVQRSSVSGPFIRHQDLPGEINGTPFSPGRFDLPNK